MKITNIVLILYGILLIVIAISLELEATKKKSIVKNSSVVIPQKVVFHLKIKDFGNKGEYYCIVFTNDDWITEQEINKVLRIKYINKKGEFYISNVINQVALFSTREEALLIAKKLNTYDLCIEYNNAINIEFDKVYKIFSEQTKQVEEPLIIKPEEIIF